MKSPAIPVWAILITLVALGGSCIKTATPPGTSSLTLVNATVGADTLIPNLNEGAQPLFFYRNAYALQYGTYQTTDEMAFYSGAQHLALYHYPDTTAHSTPVFDLNLNLPVNSIHTLFLTGTIAKPDTMLVPESIPVYAASDSVAGIRFVNLSPGSGPIRINLSRQPAGSEVNGLPYKGITDFRRYPATSNIKNDTFEIRDAIKDSVITTYIATRVGAYGLSYNPNTWIYRNNTIVFVGTPGVTTGKAKQKAYKINTY
jgi:hypothetical protein